MYSTDFEYADKRLSDFECIVCTIDKNTGVEEINIGCDITFNTIKNNHSSIHSAVSSSYDDTYNTSFQIAKKCCSNNQNDVYFTHEEARYIYRWLNRRGHYKFKPYPLDDTYCDVCYFGSFNVDEVFVDGKIIGFTLRFRASAPYAFGDDNHMVFSITESGETFSIYGDGDESGIDIYPKVKIRCMTDTGEDGLKITNLTTGNYVFIANCIAGEEITLDGEYKMIISDNEEHMSTTLPNDFNYKYLDIKIDDENEYLENVYEVSKPCEITIIYSPIRKVGV